MKDQSAILKGNEPDMALSVSSCSDSHDSSTSISSFDETDIKMFGPILATNSN